MKKLISTLLILTGLVSGIFAQNESSDSELNNLQEYKSRVFQISFVPFLGTNGMESPYITNNLSFNILAGYNGGTNGFELGGLLNIDKNNINATQIAGIGNHAGGNSTGVQISGVYNLAKNLTGTQLAGVTNIASESNGVQLAGVNNITNQGTNVQISGISNLSNDRAVFQLAGIANTARESDGSQIAGIINIANRNAGSQIAGIVNIARDIKGAQIGLINIADSCHGAAIGLVNIIRNGYQRFEISADETFQANLAYRSGVQKFHTILTAGIQPRSMEEPLWTYGIGAGTSMSVSEKMLLDIDGIFSHVVKNSEVGNNYLYKLYLGIERKISNGLALSAGVTYNFLMTDLKDNLYNETYSDIAPYAFTDDSSNRYNWKSWAGFKIGLRIR